MIRSVGPWDHGAMERHGAGRAEGAERAERAEGEGGHALGPFKSADRVQSRDHGSHGAGWDHGGAGRADGAMKGSRGGECGEGGHALEGPEP